MLVRCCQDSTWAAGVLIKIGRRVVSRISALLHLNHIPRAGAALDLGYAHDDLLGEIAERLGMGRALALKYRRLAGVAVLADVGIEFNRAKKRHAELLGCSGHAAFGEDVDFLMAV